MVLRGESANLLSVGAIDFGLIVDATVIMVENIFRHLARGRVARVAARIVLHRVRAHGDLRGKFAVIANSARRGEPGDLLLRRDHHRRLRAAVHA